MTEEQKAKRREYLRKCLSTTRGKAVGLRARRKYRASEKFRITYHARYISEEGARVRHNLALGMVKDNFYQLHRLAEYILERA